MTTAIMLGNTHDRILDLANNACFAISSLASCTISHDSQNLFAFVLGWIVSSDRFSIQLDSTDRTWSSCQGLELVDSRFEILIKVK